MNWPNWRPRVWLPRHRRLAVSRAVRRWTWLPCSNLGGWSTLILRFEWDSLIGWHCPRTWNIMPHRATVATQLTN